MTSGTMGERWEGLAAASGDVPERVRVEVAGVLDDLRPVAEAVDVLGWPTAPELYTAMDTLRAIVGLPIADEA